MAARPLSWPLPLAFAVLGAALAIPAPMLGDGVEEPTPPPVSAAPPPAPRANEPGPCVGDAPVGQVVAVTGQAEAHAPGQAPRTLACDDVLRCGELVTAPGASLSFLSGDVLVRVGGDSQVAVNGSEGAPDLFVKRGTVRSTDARSAGAAPVRLATRDLAGSASGADVEMATSAAGPARFCAFDGSAAVDAGPRARTLGAGQCLATQGGGTASFASAGEPSVGLEAPGFCSFEVALSDQLSPSDVAAPPLFLFPGGEPANNILRDPCDVPGSGCQGGNALPFDDPDPVPGCGAPGVSCGGNERGSRKD